MTDKKEPSSISSSITDEESKLFRDAIGDAKPIPKVKNVPYRKKIIAQAKFTRKDDQDVLTESMAADINLQEENDINNLKFHRSNITKKLMKKLSRGTYSIQAEIDLHGMTADETSKYLKSFIAASVKDNLTCVKVIHGKGLGSGPGGPILKKHVSHLLRKWDQVLAFTSARQVDGGTGAVYVLLAKS
tara:strand:+ start:1687 stop:2250 length:564 start_codon:yes stop_codon:yes gene_type:complete